MTLPHDQDRLQAYLDGELSPEATSEFGVELKSNLALAEALIMAARDEAIVGEWARVARRTSQIDAQLVPRLRRAPFERSWTPLAVAASLLLALGIAFWSVRPKTHALAVVEHATGRVFVITAGKRVAVATGSFLHSGQGIEVLGDESSAAVVYADGTRLEFDGDAVVTEFVGSETTAKRVVLAEGNLRADVAKQPPGRPMVLKTGNAEVVVLGTKFDLSGGTQTTYVETAEGAVRLIRASDGRAIEVPAGFEGRAGDDPEMNAQPSPPRFHQSRLAMPGNHRTTAMSPDGTTLATTRYRAGKVTFLDVSTGRERLSFAAHAVQIDATAFSPDGRMFATGAVDRTIRLWDSATGRQVQSLPAPDHLQTIAFTHDGKTLLALAGIPQNGMHLHTWDLVAGRERGEPQPIRGEAWAFSASGRLLAVASVRGASVKVWDTATLNERAVFGRLPGRVFCLAFSPNELRLAASDRSGRVVIWDLDAADREQSFYPPGGSVQGLAFSPDGTALALGLRYATVRVWDLAAGKQRFVLEGDRLPGSTASIRPMFFTPDGKTLATTQSLDDSIVRLWDLPAP